MSASPFASMRESRENILEDFSLTDIDLGQFLSEFSGLAPVIEKLSAAGGRLHGNGDTNNHLFGSHSLKKTEWKGVCNFAVLIG